MNILVTGGMGFIGTHLVNALVNEGHNVTIVDYRHSMKRLPVNNKHLDINDITSFNFKDIEVVYHLAAEVGVGQSMYEISMYTKSNIQGTSKLLEAIIEAKTVKKIIIASSMSIYGEGEYWCNLHGIIYPEKRNLDMNEWLMRCPKCNQFVSPMPTRESKPLCPGSIYAITKQTQEEMCLTIGKAYNIPTVALRYFNVYGPGQSLDNPYTGVMAIFGSRLLIDKPPIIYEDGNQLRSFVYVDDIVRANLLALKYNGWGAFNVVGKDNLTILDIAKQLSKLLNKDIEPIITNTYRKGDIRACIGDGTLSHQNLGYRPLISFANGMKQSVDWMREQSPKDKGGQALEELRSRGLC